MAVKALRPHLSMGNISFLTDVGIILVGGLLFRDIDGMIYGMIVNILSAVVIDKMIYGMNSGKVAFIVTKNGKRICDVIDECSQRGSTILKAQGGYKQDDIQVVMCACNSKEMYQVRKSVKDADPDKCEKAMQAKRKRQQSHSSCHPPASLYVEADSPFLLM